MKFKDLSIDASFILKEEQEEGDLGEALLKQKQGENTFVFVKDSYIDPETEVIEI